MKKYNYYRMIQWVVFMPLILPLCIIAGAFEGIRQAFEKVARLMQIDIAP